MDQSPGSISGQVSGDDLALVEQETQRIVRARDAFRADQFRLAGNLRAHYLHTGPEILRQSGGRIDAFCDFVGTGGTFAGCAAAFKQHNAAIGCFVVEPEGAAVLEGEPVTNPGHRIQGGGYSMATLPLLNRAHVDGYLPVTDEDAIVWARRLAEEEGIFAGFSSGANVAAARAAAARSLSGQDGRGPDVRLGAQISEHRPVGVSRSTGYACGLGLQMPDTAG